MTAHPPYHRPTPLPARLTRFARVTAHLAGGLATTVFVFPVDRAAAKAGADPDVVAAAAADAGGRVRVHWKHDAGLPGIVLIVANHISWLDIFVLNSMQPARFIAKAELKRWPVVGRLSTNVGTLFIERERRRDTHTVNRHTVEALTRGDVVAVFPEGTTSDGTSLLKFHSSLFQPIVDAEGHVQPVAIRYRTPADEHSAAPAFVGDLTMLGSFWRLTGERSLVAELHLMPPLSAKERHRRELSSEAAGAIRTVLESPARATAPDTRGDRRA